MSKNEVIVDTVRSKLTREEDLRIVDWLTQPPIDFSSQNNDYIRRRQPGTGQWFLESDKYQSWVKSDKQTLFCPGIPGAGKTILASVVIDDLCRRWHKDTTIGVAYIYCSYRLQENHTTEQLLSSLLKQLVQNQVVLPTNVKQLYDTHQATKTRPSCDEIVSTLHSTITTYSKVYIVIDALDEAPATD